MSKPNTASDFTSIPPTAYCDLPNGARRSLSGGKRQALAEALATCPDDEMAICAVIGAIEYTNQTTGPEPVIYSPRELKKLADASAAKLVAAMNAKKAK